MVTFKKSSKALKRNYLTGRPGQRYNTNKKWHNSVNIKLSDLQLNKLNQQQKMKLV